LRKHSNMAALVVFVACTVLGLWALLRGDNK
jgi:hypothetical protein